jgi:branched-chain amino acid transport system permease protein
MSMTVSLLLVQTLNGLQFGVLLFLLAAGLTLVFGIMDLINLAHGAFYMLGAYFAATLYKLTASFWMAAILALPLTFGLGLAVEVMVLRTMYTRTHLDQVLLTFGLILTFDEGVRLLWGPQSQPFLKPAVLAGQIELFGGLSYPLYRLAIIGVGLAVALVLSLLVTRTRLGMQIRAGASNRQMVGALGVNVKVLFTLVFGLGAALAGLAGLVAGPLVSIEPGMGDTIVILSFVVIVIGGIGSVRGAFFGALLVGLVDTLGRSFLTQLLSAFLAPAPASAVGPALASMLIYIFMAAVLFFRPQGLFPVPGK